MTLTRVPEGEGGVAHCVACSDVLVRSVSSVPESNAMIDFEDCPICFMKVVSVGVGPLGCCWNNHLRRPPQGDEMW